MSANQLLLWMSARGEGSWPQFRSAVAVLCESETGADAQVSSGKLPLHQLLRFNLQSLGHAEFFTSGQSLRWRVTPPVVALSEAANGCQGVMAGARYAGMAEVLSRSGLAVEALPLDFAPDALFIHAQSQGQLERAANEGGVALQGDVSIAILGCVPNVDAGHLQAKTEIPLGSRWAVDYFCPERLTWVSSTREEACGTSGRLYRFRSEYDRQYLLCRPGATKRVSQQVGKFVVLKRHCRRLLQYDQELQTLRLPAACRPPLLVERALVLCSGRPASFEPGDGRGLLRYERVPPRVAKFAASVLRQELRK